MTEKPKCAVNGLIARHGMCSQIIVGGNLCGYAGPCEHQRTNEARQLNPAEPDSDIKKEPTR